MYPSILIIIVTFFGLAFGSFLNVVILRFHDKKEGILTGRSECPNCKHILGTLDLIPVLSFLSLRGKCRYCKNKISWEYIIVEITMGAFWGFVTWASMPYILSGLFFPFIYLLLFVTILLVIAIYDLRYLEIPASFSFPFILLFLILSFHPYTISTYAGLYGGAMIYTFFYLQIIIPYSIYAVKNKKFSILKPILILPFWFILQIISPQNWLNNGTDEDNEMPSDLKEWIGFGDLRIGVLIGIVLGVKMTIVALFISYLIGALVGIVVLKKAGKKMIPFGPFLAIGAIIAYAFGIYILNFYYIFGETINSLLF